MHSVPSRTAALALALLGLGLAPAAANATVVRSHTLAEKAHLAPLIVRGTALSAKAIWLEKGQSIHTLIRFRVDEVLKGDRKAGEVITIRQSGGVIGDFDHRVPGVSRWSDNEQSIMFLEPLPPQLAMPYFVEMGIGIGKYPIVRDGNALLVTHHPRVALAVVRPDAPMSVAPATAMEPKPLNDFLGELRGYIRGRPKRSIIDAKPSLPSPPMSPIVVPAAPITPVVPAAPVTPLAPQKKGAK